MHTSSDMLLTTQKGLEFEMRQNCTRSPFPLQGAFFQDALVHRRIAYLDQMHMQGRVQRSRAASWDRIPDEIADHGNDQNSDAQSSPRFVVVQTS